MDPAVTTPAEAEAEAVDTTLDEVETVDTVSAPPRPARRFRPRPSNGSAASPVQFTTKDRAERLAEVRATSQPIREGEWAREVLDRDALLRRLLATADAVSLGFALTVSILVAGDTPTFVVVAMLPLMVLVSKVVGLYDRDEHVLHKTTLDEAPALLNVAVAGTLLAWMFSDLLATGEPFNRPQVGILFSLLFITLGLMRMLARRIALSSTEAERLLVLGSAAETRRIEASLPRISPLKAEVIGRVPVTRERQGDASDRTLGVFEDLDYLLKMHRVDRVVICPHGERSSEMLETIRLVKGLGVKVSVMPRLFEVVGSSVEFDDLGGLTLLGIRRYQLSKSSAILKRGFDVLGASAGLFVLAPLFAVVALSIKLASRGPVFFQQSRVGRGGAVFQMRKFRTMYEGADEMKVDLLHRNEGADGFFKIEDDPRITPVGRVLRRTAIDELPQLFNVLRGEMSLVGPRPLVDEEDARVEGTYRRRLDVQPGMTGAWQVLGASRIPMRDMVTIDYLYRANWSLWLDIKILLRTVPYVLRRQGL
jgi:exopolysaccharide biosynthesis polyprenyl glycosylphosphotransferase